MRHAPGRDRAWRRQLSSNSGGAWSVRQYQPIVEALALLAVTAALAIGLHLPTLWFLAPVAVITFTRRSYADYGLTWRQPGSPGFHLAVIAVVFLPYVLGHCAFEHWRSAAVFRLRFPPDFVESVVVQTVLIALPEEFFFRGYLQTQCDRGFGKPYRLLGAPVGVGLPLAAALFAACHLTYGGPARLLVFFPGLLFGWLRARTGTIVVPVLYHAGSNLLMQIMVASLSA